MPYAHNLLHMIIKEFQNPDKEITDERKGEIQKQFSRFFTDVAYNCLLVLRSGQPSDASYVNQTNKPVLKIGMHRIRAIELL